MRVAAAKPDTTTNFFGDKICSFAFHAHREAKTLTETFKGGRLLQHLFRITGF